MRQRQLARPTRIEQALVALIVLAIIVSVTWLLSQEVSGEFPSGCGESQTC